MSISESTTVRTHAHPYRRLVGTGLVATLGATLLAGLGGALARSLGVDFEVEGQAIPASGIAFQAAVFSLVGVAMAAGFLRWSARPAELFTTTAVTLTVISLVPPLLWATGVATIATLMLLHLVVAAVMIPALARGLEGRRTPAPARGRAGDSSISSD